MHYMDECSGLEGALPARMIKKMATQVLDALRVIHDSGRSMKGNCMLDLVVQHCLIS